MRRRLDMCRRCGSMEPVPISEGEKQKYICGMTMFGTAMGSWCDSACTLDKWDITIN